MGLSLKLLGEFEVRDESGEPLALPTRKTRALLAYLAVNADKPQQRERLMTLLWSDRGEQQARHSLNQALMSIRRLGNAAGAPLLDGDGERVTLVGDAIAIDVADFHERLANDPEGAAALYEGPFLDGLTIPDPAFEEWQTATRSELNNSACDALSRAADQAIKDGDLAGGIDTLRRLVALDPLHEEAHRRLMKSLHDNGNRAGALRQYQSCAEILSKDLAIEPDSLTTALFEKIKTNIPLPSSGGLEFERNAPSTDLFPPLPDKPSIAVLPFENKSSDVEQEFLADGITEDVITGLSKFRSLFVIARSSCFSFKGKRADVRQVAKELGVRYVLEGTIRGLGRRIRVSGQLIDASSGTHIWANRFDGPLEDLFELQDHVTEAIIRAIEPEIGKAELDRASRRQPDSLDAWGEYQRALTAYYATREEKLLEAIEFLDRVNVLDPRFAPGFAMAADTRSRLVIHYQSDVAGELLIEARQKAARALELDAQDPVSLWADGRVKTMLHQYDQAIPQLEQSIALNPNYAMAYHALGFALVLSGEPTRAIEQQNMAIRLSPHDLFMSGFCTVKSECHLQLGQYEEALASAQKAIRSPNPRYWAYGSLAAALAGIGRLEEARSAAAELMRLKPDFWEHLRALSHPGLEVYREQLQDIVAME